MKFFGKNPVCSEMETEELEQKSARVNLFRYLTVVTVFYVLLSAMGVTTSHSSALLGSSDEKSNVLMGTSRQQRSDEFLRGTPRAIASLQGIDLENYTPFDYSGTQEYRDKQNSAISQLNYYTSPIHILVVDEISKFLPIQIAFAAAWWVNIWLLMISFPVFFYLLGLRVSLGSLCAVAVFASPVNTWFSYLPSALLGQGFAGASLAMIALRYLGDPTIWKKVLGVLSALYAGRLAFSVAQYPPWGIPILILLAIIVVSFLSTQEKSWSLLISAARTVLIGMLAAVIVYLVNKQMYIVTLDTVYPGQRREAGGNGDQSLWSGGIAWFFQSDFARVGNFANPEVILGPTFLVIPVLFLYVRNKTTLISTKWFNYALSGSIGLLLVLIAWSQFHWPEWALKFNPLVFTPSARADQILGVLVLVPVFMMVSFISTEKVNWTTAFVVTLFTIGIASRDMQSVAGKFLPGAGSEILMWSILIVGLVTIAFLKFQSAILRILPIVLLMVGSSIMVNPLVRGVGALGDSEAATTMKELSSTAPDGRWATTGFYQDALMISTGVPQLSGQQPYGPNKEFWRILDTQNKFENNWNRGQSYVNFAWDPREDLVIWNPSGDVIQIVTNPCRSSLQDLGLRWVTSPSPLGYSCLKERAQVQWMGAPMYIYEVLNSQIFTQ
jgi:hypothetical protein